MAIRACLAKISPLDPATGNRVDVYVSSVNDQSMAPKVNGLGGLTWTPAMRAAPLLTMQLWNGDFRAAVDPGQAIVALKMEALKRTIPAADTYFWKGAAVEIYAEPAGTAWPWTARFKGTIDTMERRGQDLALTASVGTSEHEKDVLTTTYAGTGGAEGGADLKNKLKPLVIGWAQNVEPVLVDTVNNVHQFSGYGAVEAVTTLYERGSAFSPSIGDYATYAALIAATIPAGRWGTCLAQGMIRLGAPAYGVITADLKGHKISTATPRLTGAVISALATIAGVNSALIHSASLTALDAAAPYPINIVMRDQASWLEMAQKLAIACNWQAGLSLTGTFFVAAVALSGTEVITLDAQGKALPQVTGSDEQDVSVPYFKTIMGANRAWRVHSADEIAFNATLVDKGTYDAAETYREGNYVTMPDASQWLYIATTPSAGNAPPTWPTTSNAWWDNMNPPIDGVPGPPGNNSATVFLYQRTGTNVAPALPSTSSTYTFAGAGLIGHNNGWTQTVPAASGGPYLWVITAPAVSPDASVAIASGAWAVARLLAKDGEQGPIGPTGGTGPTGAAAITAEITRAAATVYAYADGSIVDFNNTYGKFTLWQGTTDITSSATLSITGSSGVAGQVNDAGNTPIGSSPKGTYRATGLTVDNGTLTISAVYGGNTYSKTMTLVRVKAGFEPVTSLPGDHLFIGRTVFLTTDEKIYRYTSSGWTPAIDGADISNGSVAVAKFASGIEPVTITSGAVPGTKSTNVIYNAGKLYRWNGTSYVATVPTVDLTGTIGTVQIADAALTTAKFAASIEPVTLVAGALPTTRVTQVITYGGKLYRWDGSAYVASVAANDITGTIGAAQITDASLTTAKFAAGIEPVTVVSAVPGAKVTNSIFNTTDGKIYRWSGSAYTASVPGSDIVADSITAGQIAAGAIGASEIAAGAVTASKITITDAENLFVNSDFAGGSMDRWDQRLEGNGVNGGITIQGSASWPSQYALTFNKLTTANVELSATYGSISPDVDTGRASGIPSNPWRRILL